MTRGGAGATLKVLGLRAAVILTTLSVWEIAVRARWVNEFLVGTPSGILVSFRSMWAKGIIQQDILTTLTETVLGYSLGTAAGSVLGMLLWTVPPLARAIEPILVGVNSIPKIAIAPLVVVWFGVGITSKVALAAFICLIVSIVTTYQGTLQADPRYLELMKSLDASKLQVFRKIIVPASWPWVITAARLNIGFSLLGAVAGEFISARAGLGYRIYFESSLMNVNGVFVGILVLLALSLIVLGGVDAGFRRLLGGRRREEIGREVRP